MNLKLVDIRVLLDLFNPSGIGLREYLIVGEQRFDTLGTTDFIVLEFLETSNRTIRFWGSTELF